MPTERGRALSVITLAFATDPLVRWTLPDPAVYLGVMANFTDAFGGPGIDLGAALLADDGTGAALWLPPGVHPDAERMGVTMQQHLTGRIAAEAGALMAQMAAHHPDGPHWYLPLIGVDPHRQGLGYGAALMRFAAERCDREASLAYLESSNPRNISLYQRYGFEILGSLQVGSSPVVTPMLRRPR